MSKTGFIAGIGLPVLLVSSLAQAAESGHGGHHVDWIYVASLFFNFIAFIIIGVMLLRKPLAVFFATRAKEIAEALAAADRAKEKAENTIKEFSAKIETLNNSKEETISTARKEAEYERERLLDAARRQAKHIVEDTTRALEIATEKAKQDLSREAVIRIAEEAEAMLEKAMTEEDGLRLADEYSNQLREVKRALNEPP